jgi:hypothetical protein
MVLAIRTTNLFIRRIYHVCNIKRREPETCRHRLRMGL